MHAKLAAYAATQKLDANKLNERIKKACPPAMTGGALRALSDDEKDHPKPAFLDKVVGHLKALDDMEGEEAEEANASSPKALRAQLKGLRSTLKTLGTEEGEDISDEEEEDWEAEDEAESDEKAKALKTKALKAKMKALKAKATLKAKLKTLRAQLAASPLEDAAKGKLAALNTGALTALSVALGGTSDDPADAVVRRAVTQAEGINGLYTRFSVRTLSALDGKLAALQSDAEEGRKASTELAQLKANQTRETAVLSIAAAEKESRLTPAKKVQAETYLAAGNYEALNAYLGACDPIPALAGAAPTQLSVEAHAALQAAGAHPAQAAAPPPKAPDISGAVHQILSNPDFLAAAKGLGIAQNPMELGVFARQMIADNEGKSVTDLIAALSAGA